MRMGRRIAFAALAAATAALASFALPGYASAANFVVNTTADEFGTGSPCSLREAIQAANTTPPFSGCTGTNDGPDTITLTGGQTYVRTLTGADETNAAGDLDVLNEDLTIVTSGVGNATIQGTSAPAGDRVLDIGPLGAAITVTISGVNIESGNAGTTNLGGGIIVQSGRTLNFSNGDFFNNQAQFGGALENTAGTTNLTNTTISGNAALNDGGGVDQATGTLALNSSTVSDNESDSDIDGNGDGGGVFRLTGTMTLFNSIVAGNTDHGGASVVAPDCSGSALVGPASLGYNLIGDTSNCGFVPTTGDQTNVPAGLDALGASGNTKTHALLAGSPAIDAGAPSGVPATDQRGVARPQGARCDIGAFELVASTVDGSTCEGPPLSAPQPPASAPASAPITFTHKKKCKKHKQRALAAKKKCKRKRR
jgi:CSLREA domain-containing protein